MNEYSALDQISEPRQRIIARIQTFFKSLGVHLQRIEGLSDSELMEFSRLFWAMDPIDLRPQGERQ